MGPAAKRSNSAPSKPASFVRSRNWPVTTRVALPSQWRSIYLDLVRHHQSLRTYRTYRYTLDTLLRESYTKVYVDQVERQDVLKFMTDCYRRGLGNRTVYDKLVVVLQLFKRHGKTKLIESSDWPDYVDTIRPIYEAEEIGAMLRHAAEGEAIFSSSCSLRVSGIVRFVMSLGVIWIFATVWCA